MKPTDDIRQFFRRAAVDTRPNMDESVLETILTAHDKKTDQPPGAARPSLRSITMKNPIAKLAIAAAIIAAVVLGLFEFIDTNGTSGVVWAEVVERVEASRGVIFRERATNDRNAHTEGSDYSITYLSPTQYRSEGFKRGQPWLTMYDNRATGKRVVLVHAQKGYVREEMTLTDKGNQKHANIMEPRWWVRQFLACEYTELEPKTIDGVFCEGLETSDPALVPDADFRIDSLLARLWVDVETGYPVLLESEFTGQHSGSMVYDQFQWDVVFDAGVFEPNIPADYEQM